MKLNSAIVREARVAWPRLPRHCAGMRRRGRRRGRISLDAPCAARAPGPDAEQVLREYFRPCLSVFVRD